MDSSEYSWAYSRKEIEDSSDLRSDRAGDDEEWKGNGKREHRSSKPRKLGNGEEIDGLDGSVRRRSSGDERIESQKRSVGGSSRADSDDDDYETRKDLRSKHIERKQEESSLEKLSNWYQDGELDNRLSGGKSGNKGQGCYEESDRRKVSSKISDQQNACSGGKIKEERFHDGEQGKALDRDSRYTDRKESSWEKNHSSTDSGRNVRRKWDESDAYRKAKENHHEKADLRSSKTCDSKYESSKDRSASARNEPSESKSCSSDPNIEEGIKSSNREDRRTDADRSKIKGGSEAVEEDNKVSPHEDRSSWERTEKYRQQRSPTGKDVVENCERYSNVDEDGDTWIRDKNAREVGHSNRSRTPERSLRCHLESHHCKTEYNQGSDLRQKDCENDSHREDKLKARDDSWNDRNRDRESSKENWRRRQQPGHDRESKDGDIYFDRGRDREPRHGRERSDDERPYRTRGEAVKTSSNFGISNENCAVIEIQTKPLDYGRADSGSNFARRNEFGQQSDVKSTPNVEELSHMWDERARIQDSYGTSTSVEDSKERYLDDGASMQDPNSYRDDMEYQGEKGRGQKGLPADRQSPSGSSLPSFGNQESGSFGGAPPYGGKVSRGNRGRGRPTGRDNRQVGLPLPIMGSPFGPIGMPPPGPMQPLGPAMAPGPGGTIPLGVFIPPFSLPVMWPGAQGVEMNLLGVPPALSPAPPGPSGPRFPPNLGTSPSNTAMLFNPLGPGRGVPTGTSSPGFNSSGSVGRGTQNEKIQGGWVPSRSNGLPGKAPSRGEQNDYSQNFVDTGMWPQNFIRELDLSNVVEDYPKLRELIQKKDEIVVKSASPPMYLKCDLREFELSPEFLGTKFDVILVDPPWEEYVHRAPVVADHMEYWTFEEIMNLKVESIADTPSFIFLWVGDGVGLDQGRQCLKKWGFRRCEDICWVKTNKNNATPGLRHDSHTLFQHSKEHCLMGIKGTVRRSTDGHIIHANIDTDIIIAEEPPYGSTQKPEDMYHIIEHFALGRRRLELFGEDHNIRAGWLTVGKGLSSSNFNTEAYIRNFSDKDGKVWQGGGGGGRNPPPEAPHLVLTTPEIEALRPKSPMKNQQQQQQQSASISLTTANSSNRRPAGNSSQNPNAFSLNQENSSSNPSTPALWASPMEVFRARESGNMLPEDKVYDTYSYNAQANGEYLDFESHRQINLL